MSHDLGDITYYLQLAGCYSPSNISKSILKQQVVCLHRSQWYYTAAKPH